VPRHEHCLLAPLWSHLPTLGISRRSTARISPCPCANSPVRRLAPRIFTTPQHPCTIETPYSRECERLPSSRCIKSAPARPMRFTPTVCRRGASDTALRHMGFYPPRWFESGCTLTVIRSRHGSRQAAHGSTDLTVDSTASRFCAATRQSREQSEEISDLRQCRSCLAARLPSPRWLHATSLDRRRGGIR